jgi:cellulose synthase/poly-beta-1,6-N-acetylglucosamine synthase-like glycosyltransferase
MAIFSFIALYYFYFIQSINQGIKKLSRQGSKGVNPSEFISIIIPFRNESECILKSLASIEAQQYPKDKFEVIYVNDCSDDDSLEKIVNAQKSENIKVISVPQHYAPGAHKKRAIKYAIEQAKGDIIVSTDCDCIHSKYWLEAMLSLYDEETAFISGPVSFLYDDSAFSRLQALEFSGLILIGAGLIGLGSPTSCNAANLSYRKKVYNEVGGFSGNMNLSSGDDEFLMQKIASTTNYKIKFNPQKRAIAFTEPNKTVGEFFQQRKRWASKGLFYKDKVLILKLFMIFLFYVSLPLQLLASIFYSEIFLLSFLISFLLKITFETQFLLKGLGFLFEKKLLLYILPAEILQIPYIIFASIAGSFGNYKWKDRKLKR